MCNTIGPRKLLHSLVGTVLRSRTRKADLILIHAEKERISVLYSVYFAIVT